MSMRSFGRRLVMALAVSVGGAACAHASDWIEPRSNDAGEFASFAQIPFENVFAQLDSITGSLDAFEPNSRGIFMGQDLFQIYIQNPSTFSARTVATGSGFDVDTKLFLFSMSGLGLLVNDNVSSSSQYSELLASSTGGVFQITTPGVYVIGVTATSNSAASGVNPIFPTFTTGIHGPTGPGGAGVHDNWLGSAGVGDYRIELTGVYSVPAPSAAGLLSLALFAANRRNRRS